MLQLVVFTFCLLEIMFSSATTAHTDCSKLPNPINPNECCNFPKLFKLEALNYCNNTQVKGEQCFYECVFTATEICRNGKCSYDKASDYVDWVMTAENPFTSIYKDAYRQCINKAREIRSNMVQHFKRYGCDPIPEMIYLCVQNEMFTACPTEYWNDNTAECHSKREFIKNCVRNE